MILSNNKHLMEKAWQQSVASAAAAEKKDECKNIKLIFLRHMLYSDNIIAFFWTPDGNIVSQ